MDEARVHVSRPDGRLRLLSTWGPVIAWAAVIFALSSIPSLGTGLGTWDVALRKLAHVTEYAIFAFLVRRALAAPAAFGLAVAYAMSDELHQSFVRGREGRPRDVAIDAVGIALGLLAARRRP
jgi:NAD-dependent oxidoreductase involved in siderophore biosynthesis